MSESLKEITEMDRRRAEDEIALDILRGCAILAAILAVIALVTPT